MATVALLATGDEVVEGEILNRNSQTISQLLTDAGYEIGLHVACRDDLRVMSQLFTQLIDQYDVVISTGGLGPTEDDKTRFVIADVLGKPLIFNQSSWDWIVGRYQKMQIEIPESNRQQALFPKGATIFSNENGSADACLIESKGKIVVMLPGPPSECMPIIQGPLLPVLTKLSQPNFPPIKRWRLFGIAESQLADEINNQFPEIKSEIGYRWHYPYIDVKYRHHDPVFLAAVCQKLSKYLARYQICESHTTASRALKDYLTSINFYLAIDDQVTGGLLQSAVYQPETRNNLVFGRSQSADVHVSLTGLDAYWRQENQPTTEINIALTSSSGKDQKSYTIPNRPLKLTVYAMEFIAVELLKVLPTLV